MAMPERYNPECPPDAHKVIREAETKVLATLCIKVLDSELENGIDNVVQILSLMAKTPLILCSDDVKAKLIEEGKKQDTAFNFVNILDEKSANLVDANGFVGATTDYFDLGSIDADKSEYLELLTKKAFIIIDPLSMFTLRSISTVFPWDKLLAAHFFTQYKNAVAALTEDDLKLLSDVRYGRFDALNIKDKSETAYTFHRLERKLFLQYPEVED